MFTNFMRLFHSLAFISLVTYSQCYLYVSPDTLKCLVFVTSFFSWSEMKMDYKRQSEEKVFYIYWLIQNEL